MSATATRTQHDYRLAVAPIRNVVVRDASGTGDGSWTVEGYAAVYEQETVLFDLSWIRVREEIARGAFGNVLARLSHGDGLVHLNFGHDMKTAIAATDVSGIGGLELTDDFHGLRFFARVDQDDPDAQRLAVKMQRGVVRQASFAFTIEREELVEFEEEAGKWDEKWRILEIKDLFDVCACPQGAYPQTESYIRSLAAASLGRAGYDPAGHDRRIEGREPLGGGSSIAPAEPTGEGESRAERERTLATNGRIENDASAVLRKYGVTHP